MCHLITNSHLKTIAVCLFPVPESRQRADVPNKARVYDATLEIHQSCCTTVSGFRGLFRVVLVNKSLNHFEEIGSFEQFFSKNRFKQRIQLFLYILTNYFLIWFLTFQIINYI